MAASHNDECTWNMATLEMKTPTLESSLSPLKNTLFPKDPYPSLE